jgi:hypothetical protein
LNLAEIADDALQQRTGTAKFLRGDAADSVPRLLDEPIEFVVVANREILRA